MQGSEAVNAPRLAAAVTFGAWRFDYRAGGLFRQTAPGRWAPVAVGSRAQDILAVLLRDPGALVSKDDLLNAAWPGVIVEPNNLTVQMTALRRVLGDGGAETYIQTVPGRGYRFVCPVAPPEPAAPAQRAVPIQNAPPAVILAAPGTLQTAPAARSASVRRRWWRNPWLAGGIVMLLACVVAWNSVPFLQPAASPRLSLVVMPFENTGNDPDDRLLGDAITNDLTSDMTRAWELHVISQEAARPYAAQRASPHQTGAGLAVRYMVTGAVRRQGGALHVNTQLVSTETGVQLWSDRFETPAADPGAAREAAVRHIGLALHFEMIAIEAARSGRERPDHPDAIDLFLQARLLQFQPPDARRQADVLALYERALERDPSSVPIQVRLASVLLDNEDITPQGRKAVLLRTTALLDKARAQRPTAEMVQLETLHWLSWQRERCAETIEASRHFIALYPRAPQPYRWLGWCLITTGHAEEAIPVLETAVLTSPLDPWKAHDHRNLAFALLLLGRYDAAILRAQRALALNAGESGFERARLLRWMAAAYALTGQMDDARRTLAKAVGLWPYATVRGVTAEENAGAGYVAQIEHLRDGLRLAGLRDHAEPDADFGAKPSGAIQQTINGRTPTAMPGVTTIDAAGLTRLLAERKPVVIDTLWLFAGRSIPGAIGLRYAGEGGALSDAAQDHLRATMTALTEGDLAKPVVAVGWNSETFDGANLALRLAALGYQNVYWYRGGREDWEVQGLPLTDTLVKDW